MWIYDFMQRQKKVLNNQSPFKFDRPVHMRLRFWLHRRVPNAIGNGRRNWFGSNPSAGKLVMTIPIIVWIDAFYAKRMYITINHRSKSLFSEPMQFHCQLHGHLPNTVGKARHTWLGSIPSAGRIVTTNSVNWGFYATSGGTHKNNIKNKIK